MRTQKQPEILVIVFEQTRQPWTQEFHQILHILIQPSTTLVCM